MPENMELDTLFVQEVRTQKEKTRPQAVQVALAVLAGHEFGDKVTVKEFLDGLRGTRDMWDVVSGMSIIHFAQNVANVRALAEENHRLRVQIAGKPFARAHHGAESGHRTRLTNVQKEKLKQAIVQILHTHPQGLSRVDVAAHITDRQLREMGLPRGGLATKLRTPMAELQEERLVITAGEKRLTRYLLERPKGSGRAARSAR